MIGVLIACSIVFIILLVMKFEENKTLKTVEEAAYSIFEGINNGDFISEELLSKNDYNLILEDLHNKHFNKIDVVKHIELDKSKRVVVFRIELFSLDEQNNIVFARADNVMVNLMKNKSEKWEITKITFTEGN